MHGRIFLIYSAYLKVALNGYFYLQENLNFEM